MVETDHCPSHPFFNRPVYSLYSETREPTLDMLHGLDHFVVDLQDVGSRIYTFIYTMTYAMEACGRQGIEVVVLDRPNPIGGHEVEGNILRPPFSSFVGRHPLPARHAMTMGEVALWAKKYCGISCELQVISCQGWNRKDNYGQTELPWVPPSPNMPTVESTLPFVGTVLFEGTSVSEGRGTTRPLEMVGLPHFDPWKHLKGVQKHTQDLSGFVLRPCHFQPTFQKHAGQTCGGYQIHVTDQKQFRPWALAQLLCQYFYHNADGFKWKEPPYEYETEKLPIDIINGTDEVRKWVEEGGDLSQLKAIEQEGREEFLKAKKSVELYS